MANILCPSGYIKVEKQKALKKALIMLVFMVASYLFAVFYIADKFPKLFFIVLLISAFCTLLVAQSAVRYLLMFTYKDDESDITQRLENLSDELYLFNSLIITDGNKRAFLEHVVVNNKEINVFLVSSVKNKQDKMKEYKVVVNNIFHNKGVDCKINFITTLQDAEMAILKLKNTTKRVAQTDEIADILRIHAI